MWGGGNDLESNGKPALAWADTIVVTLGYRLSIFGFLCLSEFRKAEEAECNYGLLDQIAAVEWLHTNIAAFGGDPDNIVLWGESAGVGHARKLCKRNILPHMIVLCDFRAVR